MKKFDEGVNGAFGLTATKLNKPCSKPPLNTVSKPDANQLPKALPKVLHKPVKHTNKKAFAATMADEAFRPSGERLPFKPSNLHVT